MFNVNAKPVFKYIGGKRWLASELREALSGYDKKVYSEVFCGGLGSFTSVVDILALERYEKIELNDINKNIVGVYYDIINNREELIERLCVLHSRFINTIPNFEEVRELSGKIENKKLVKNMLVDAEIYFKGIRDDFNLIKFEKPSVETSALLIMIQMLGFNGIYRENLSGFYNVGYCWEAKNFIDLLVGRIIEFSKLKDFFEISFSSLDFRDFKYSNDKLFYADPPYIELNNTNSKMKYSMSTFCLDTQKSLIDRLSGNSFVYSNHYNDDIINYLNKTDNDLNILNVNRRNTMSSKAIDRGKTISEILVIAKEKPTN